MKSQIRGSLAKRVLAISSLIFSLPLLIYFFLVFRFDYTTKLEEVVRNFSNLGRNRALILSDLTKYDFRMLEMIEEFIFFAKIENKLSNEKINNALKTFSTTGRFDTISYFQVTPDGQYICKLSSDPSKINGNYTNYHYVQNAVIYDQISFLAFGSNSLQRRFYVSKTIYNKRTHELEGVLTISTSINELLKKVLISETAPYPIHVSILTEEQVIFESSHPDFSLKTLGKLTLSQLQKIEATNQFGQTKLPVDHILKNVIKDTPNEQVLELQQDGKVYIAIFMPIPGTDLTLLLHADKDKVYSPEHKALIYVLVIFIAIFLVGATATLILTRRMSKPLGTLCEVMGEVKQGNLQKRFTIDKWGFELNVLGDIFNRTIDQLLNHMEEAENERVLKETLEKELMIGYEIQTTILPRKLPICPGIEMVARYYPAKEVGGDFYDVFLKDHGENQTLFITIADAAGKGISACLYSLCLRSMLRCFYAEHDDLGKIVSRANQLLCLDTENTGMFVTVLTSIYNPKTRTLTYLSAGHNPGYILRKNGSWELLENPGMAMGVVDFPSPTAQTVQLQVGDLVFLYTDGVTETPTPLGELYGENRLKSFIEKNQGIPVETLADELLKDLVRFSEDTSQFDDITIISFRVI
jgi:sigma-B regulation protein RsbU (phosphoserine phosphatase)